MNTKIQKIDLGDVSLDVIHKDIKNVHLSVHPPTGRVRISAPLHMDLDTVRIFAISKLSWVKKQQTKFNSQDREPKRDYISRENHYYLGKRYLIKIIEHNAPPKINLKHSKIEMYVRPNTSVEKKHNIMNEWYRNRLKEIVPAIIKKYEKLMQVRVHEFGIRKMRTKWGTCNNQAKRIWLNLELAKKPKNCIEYIIVHEMVHLLERRHNDNFIYLMNMYMPQWNFSKDELNRSPLGHIDWGY
jgi:predicted metal-dependent hydrolase